MKQYTHEDFESFERIDERIICPSGDYTAIQEFPSQCSFGEGCSFGEWCSFGEGCSFGEWCSFGDRCNFGEHCSCEFGEFTQVFSGGGFGSVGRTTYFFVLKDQTISVRCGCFAGTLDEWKEKVRETHDSSKLARAYLALGAAVEIMAKET